MLPGNQWQNFEYVISFFKNLLGNLKGMHAFVRVISANDAEFLINFWSIFKNN